MSPTLEYQNAANKILTSAAAQAYCAGDMSVTDQAGHDAIEREVTENN